MVATTSIKLLNYFLHFLLIFFSAYLVGARKPSTFLKNLGTHWFFIRNNPQPFYLKLRVLIPSHTMDCAKAVTVCDVRGCGQTVRREEKDAHLTKNQMRHFSLMKKHQQDLLWNMIQGVRTGMILRSFLL